MNIYKDMNLQIFKTLAATALALCACACSLTEANDDEDAVQTRTPRSRTYVHHADGNSARSSS